MKKALICGASGQDGAYLSKLLLSKGYKVYGASRDAQVNSFDNLRRLEILEQVELVSVTLTDFRSVLQTLLRVEPDEVYNLAGQSSVGLSFDQPVETLESISLGSLNLLEAIRFSQAAIRYYGAGSSECFGDTGDNAADEETQFRPKSPYGVAKSAAFWQTANYREAYDLFCSTGLLFNHESPLRPERFVTRKIVAAACRIADGSNEKLSLGDTSIRRDWGWAPEYVEAMWSMMQLDKPQDFVIATGQAHSLQDFVALAFEALQLDWKDYVETGKHPTRPTEIRANRGNPDKARRILGWEPKVFLSEIVRRMIDAEQRTLSSALPDGR